MGALNPDRLEVVRALLETAPDPVVRDLEAALKGEASGALAPVRAMVGQERADRRVRDVVLGPVAPLCAPRADGFQQTLFPSGVLTRVWKGLRRLEPTAVTVVASNLTLSAQDDNQPPALDDLCRAAAAGVRAGADEMERAVRFLEDFRPGAAAQFASYLELAPLARRALRRLPAWLRNMSGEHVAAVRLLFKDADDIADDASPRLLEMLLAHSAEPWKLLRVVSAVSNRGGDRYLSSSELAGFCERVMADIERRVAVVRAFEFDAGAEAAQAAAEALALGLAEVVEFEEWLDLNKEGPWGQRIGKHKHALSSLTEGMLKKCPRLVADALPVQPVRLGGITVRSEPKLDLQPDGRLVGRAMAALTFFERCRASAASGGCGAVRAKVGEEVVHRLDTYVEDILAMVHAGEEDKTQNARAYLEVVAHLMGLAADEKSAQIVRRRAAVA